VQKRPTVSDVAELAGVHRSTAARALNPASSGMLTPDTVRRVQRAARTLGYSTNAFARGLRTNRSMTVGVLIPDLNNPLFPPIVRGIEKALLSRGYTALLANTDNDADREGSSFAALLARHVDGFLVATARDNDLMLDEAARREIPTVLLNRANTGCTLPLVTGDDRAGIRSAVDHLVAAGHRRIGHLAGPEGVSTAEVRLAGFRESLADRGLAGPVVRCGSFTEAAGAEAAAALLAQHPDLTAVIAANDLIALGALRTLQVRGLRCPEDVSLVGFNDMRFADAFNPPLTTVHVPHEQMGTEGARLLLERLDDPTAPAKSLLLPLHLVVRASTAPPQER
jgi:LacI family transcriptional regulator